VADPACLSTPVCVRLPEHQSQGEKQAGKRWRDRQTECPDHCDVVAGERKLAGGEPGHHPHVVFLSAVSV